MVVEKNRFMHSEPHFRGKTRLMAEISPEAYGLFQAFLLRTCGIRLGDNKRYLVINRLAGVCQNAGIPSLDELIGRLNTGSLSRSIVTDIIDAMTTNETFWFRDAAQFGELKNVVLPELSKNRFLTPRIWSAGCSSGQEPYSISISIDEYNRYNVQKALANIQIMGTDLSESILERAKNAIFSDLELSRGLNDENRSRYFRACHGGRKLDSKITSRVRFQPFNLQKPFAVLGQFEIIFCRNVLIYFSDDLKRDILIRMSKILKPGGYLFLSSTETVPCDLGEFELVKGCSVRYFRKA
ncbi:MAG: CheR family methyltransferase [Methylococcales bacterium]